MDLSRLHAAPGSRKKSKKIGRGLGSGHGGTSCRGHKGQKSRSGGSIPPWFEGGQMPLQRRVPKRGFTNIFRKEVQIINLGSLEQYGAGDTVSPDTLFDAGLISKKDVPIKILAFGEIKNALSIEAHAFSKNAIEKIENAGGKAILL